MAEKAKFAYKAGYVMSPTGMLCTDETVGGYFAITKLKYLADKEADLLAYMLSKNAEIKAISGLLTAQLVKSSVECTMYCDSTIVASYQNHAMALAIADDVSATLAKLVPHMVGLNTRLGSKLMKSGCIVRACAH